MCPHSGGWGAGPQPGKRTGPSGRQPRLQSRHRVLGGQDEVWAKPEAASL